MTKGTGIIIFILGAAVGAVGSLFYLRKEFQKKVEEEVTARDMAIRELKKASDNKDYELRETNRKFNEKVATEISKRLGYSEDNVSALVRNAPRTHSDASESKLEDDIAENSYPTEGNADIPYGISVDDFLTGRKEYEKTTLTFYAGDQVLATEDGDIIEDVPYILGPDWTNYVGKYEDKIAYIRNENAGTDYEVIVEARDYTDDFAT